MVTLVMSSLGFIRQVRGHIGDVFTWSYKAGTWSHW